MRHWRCAARGTGGNAVAIAGGAEAHALGWAADGRAVVYLTEGICGSAYERGPGVYLVDPATGAVDLIYAIGAAAKMWSPLEG